MENPLKDPRKMTLEEMQEKSREDTEMRLNLPRLTSEQALNHWKEQQRIRRSQGRD